MIRRFFKALWNTLTAVRMALANLLFVLLLVVIWLAVSERPEPLPESAALLLDPSGRVVDERSRIEPASLLLQPGDSVSGETALADLIDSVKLARDDERISALVLDLGSLLSIGQSKTTELAQVIEAFRETGKPVIALGDYFSQDQYRLAVEADTVLMHPYGAVALEGYSVYPYYFAEALNKLDVTVHVFRAGDYKSVGEPFLRDGMSEGEREVTRAWLSDLWAAYSGAVERRRGLERGAINALLNNYAQRLGEQSGNPGQLALSAGLVDQLLDRSQQGAYVAERIGEDSEDGEFTSISFRDYLPRARRSKITPGAPTVAIVNAEGFMYPGEQPPGSIGSDTLVRRLRSAVERDNVKALVLRINSGGGSVFASELIRAELERIRQQGTTLVVSMGAVAASGGYYIATAADSIYATPATITGSIGVFLAYPTAERLLDRLGVHADGLGTTELAGGLRPDRPLSPELASVLQMSVEEIYRQFLDLILARRPIDAEALDSVAQGRTLSAQAALDAGLIDELGSLDDAIDRAAELAGLEGSDYEVISIEPPRSPGDLILQRFGDALGLDSVVTPGMKASIKGAARLQAPLRDLGLLLESFSDPRNLYMRCLVCEPL